MGREREKGEERERKKYLTILNSMDCRKNIYFHLLGRIYASYLSLPAPTQKLILDVNVSSFSAL